MPLILWSDALIFLLVFALAGFFLRLRRDPQIRARWSQVFSSRLGVATFTVIICYVGVALLDSLHFRRALEPVGRRAERRGVLRQPGHQRAGRAAGRNGRAL